MKLPTNSLKENVYKGIIEKIVKGEYKPGSIITEGTIISEFKCSKSPVREAMVELCKDEILVSIPRYGYQVTQVTMKTIHEITKLRILLELSNFQEIERNFTKEEISNAFLPLEAIRKENKTDVWKSTESNLQFHLTLAGLSGNTILSKMLKRLFDMFTLAYAQMYIMIPNSMAPEKNHNHSLFLQAWKNRNYEEAENYLKDDILIAEKELRNFHNSQFI